MRTPSFFSIPLLVAICAGLSLSANAQTPQTSMKRCLPNEGVKGRIFCDGGSSGGGNATEDQEDSEKGGAESIQDNQPLEKLKNKGTEKFDPEKSEIYRKHIKPKLDRLEKIVPELVRRLKQSFTKKKWMTDRNLKSCPVPGPRFAYLGKLEVGACQDKSEVRLNASFYESAEPENVAITIVHEMVRDISMDAKPFCKGEESSDCLDEILNITNLVFEKPLSREAWIEQLQKNRFYFEVPNGMDAKAKKEALILSRIQTLGAKLLSDHSDHRIWENSVGHFELANEYKDAALELGRIGRPEATAYLLAAFNQFEKEKKQEGDQVDLPLRGGVEAKKAVIQALAAADSENLKVKEALKKAAWDPAQYKDRDSDYSVQKTARKALSETPTLEFESAKYEANCITSSFGRSKTKEALAEVVTDPPYCGRGDDGYDVHRKALDALIKKDPDYAKSIIFKVLHFQNKRGSKFGRYLAKKLQDFDLAYHKETSELMRLIQGEMDETVKAELIRTAARSCKDPRVPQIYFPFIPNSGEIGVGLAPCQHLEVVLMDLLSDQYKVVRVAAQEGLDTLDRSEKTGMTLDKLLRDPVEYRSVYGELPSPPSYAVTDENREELDSVYSNDRNPYLSTYAPN